VATIADLITTLTTRLTSINAKIEKQEAFRSLEEGSASSRFRTEFTDIKALYDERDKLQIQLTTLEMSQL